MVRSESAQELDRTHMTNALAIAIEVSPESWWDHAACSGKTHLFFPLQGQNGKAKAAKRICNEQCPVRVECLEHALMTGDDQGIRGGLGEDQRRRMRRAWRKMASGELAGGQRRLNRLVRKTVYHLDEGETPEWIAQRNTEGATCGTISKFNRGCRCEPCHEALALANHRRKQRESAGQYA